MKKRLTQEEFIEKANCIHKGFYDYSKVKYVDGYTKVCILCPIHGEFMQRPYEHLKGQKCRKCAFENQKKLVFGKGINDMSNVSRHKSYLFWIRMLRRCYDEKTAIKHPTYNDCTVCDEWLTFSNFYKWFNENYIDGFELDKDILIKGNKEYAPNKCCFVPKEVNALLTKRQNRRGECPIGVHRTSDHGFRFIVSKNGKSSRAGKFYSMDDAFNAYKEAKEMQIKCVADKYKDVIAEQAYNALYNYKVEITD